MVALLHRAHADGAEVGARVGLGEREAAAQLARRHARQEARLLLLGAELLHQHRHHQVRVEDAGERHPDGGDLHHDLRVGGSRESEAAPFRIEHRAEEAHLLHRLDHLARIDVVVLQAHHLRAHFLLQPAMDRLQQRGFLGGIGVTHELSG
jgi:hypothetical protein